jgi:hypothetical protein
MSEANGSRYFFFHSSGFKSNSAYRDFYVSIVLAYVGSGFKLNFALGSFCLLVALNTDSKLNLDFLFG